VVKKEKEIDFFDVENKIDDDLFEFFSTINYEKKKKKEKLNSIIGEIKLDDIFEEITAIKKKNKIKKQKENSTLHALKEFLISDTIEEKIEEENIVEDYILDQDVIEEEFEEIIESTSEPISEQNQQSYLIEKSLGLLAEPSDTKVQNDPLTPLDQKFATLDDLDKHYKLFLSRIQQQLSTLGGGGETNLAYMDMPLKYITTSSYTVTPQDYYIGVNYAGAVTITLPTPRKNGKTYIVKDELGEASKGVNRYITILPSGSDTIDGRDRAFIAYDYGSLTFVYRNGWRVV